MSEHVCTNTHHEKIYKELPYGFRHYKLVNDDEDTSLFEYKQQVREVRKDRFYVMLENRNKEMPKPKTKNTRNPSCINNYHKFDKDQKKILWSLFIIDNHPKDLVYVKNQLCKFSDVDHISIKSIRNYFKNKRYIENRRHKTKKS
jgi:hypothetical protein